MKVFNYFFYFAYFALLFCACSYVLLTAFLNAEANCKQYNKYKSIGAYVLCFLHNMTLTENITWKRFNKLWIVCLKVLFLRDGQLATTTKCQLCILCQKQTEENLVCPLENPVASRREGAYTDMIGLVSQCNARDSNSGLPRESPISYH